MSARQLPGASGVNTTSMNAVLMIEMSVHSKPLFCCTLNVGVTCETPPSGLVTRPATPAMNSIGPAARSQNKSTWSGTVTGAPTRPVTDGALRSEPGPTGLPHAVKTTTLRIENVRTRRRHAGAVPTRGA